jgi:hypothetical protein
VGDGADPFQALPSPGARRTGLSTGRSSVAAGVVAQRLYGEREVVAWVVVNPCTTMKLGEEQGRRTRGRRLGLRAATVEVGEDGGEATGSRLRCSARGV